MMKISIRQSSIISGKLFDFSYLFSPLSFYLQIQMQVRLDLNSRCFKKNKKILGSLTYTKKKSAIQKKKKNKSKEQTNKTNYHHSKSKSNNKRISPLPLRKTKLNNSPFSKKQKSRSRQLSNRKTLTYRDNDKKSHVLSTKIVTQRSPYIQKQLNTKHSPQKKNKQKKKVKKVKQTEQQNMEPVQSLTERLRIKKQIPFIKTNFSDRRQSYFDEKVLKQLNIKHAQSIKKEELYHEQFGLTSTKVQLKELKKTFKDFGTQTDPEHIVSHRDIESFRKEQQLKWRIICLQLNSIKCDKQRKQENKNHILDTIINESQQNFQRVLEDEQRILKYRSLDCYIVESPVKVKKALKKERKSLQEQREILKNHSDNKLLHEIQIMQNIGDISFIKDESEKHSFCRQFQKQLESYRNEGSSSLFNPVFVPEIQLNKANQIYETIEHILFIQFCQELAKQEHILHQYLISIKDSQKQQQTIHTSNTYSFDLVARLFQYIIENNQTQSIMHVLNIPFGNEPLTSLKWIRDYFKDDSHSHSSIEETPEPILDSQLLNQFDATNYHVPVESQYFYHHCIYGCINQILDTFRPFGIQGRPPLFNDSIRSCFINFEEVKKKATEKFSEIISICMGKTEFEEEEENPVLEMEKTFKKMDKSIVEQENMKWKSNEDIKFENTYLISTAIFEEVICQQALAILRQFSK